MAVNDNPREDPAHDPHLARLMAAVGDEQPPAALDAAIRAAARREVSARPQTAGGGTATPVVRGKRNWYVPVSIAAVLVLSVSLVTLVHEEKGDELAQPKAPASVDTLKQEPVPQLPQAPASAPVPPASPALADATPSAPAKAEPRRAEANQDRVFIKTERANAEATAEPQRADAAKMTPPEPSRQARQTESSAPVVAAAPEAASAVGGATPGAAPVMTPPASQSPPPPMKPMLAKERRPEPFPSSAEREVPAAAARLPSEPDATAPQQPRVFRDAAPAPAVAAAPPPLAAGQTEDARVRSAPAVVQGRVAAAPPPAAMPEAKPMARPAAKPAASPSVARPAWLNDLENQPPEKWLERLAEFKRDSRVSDAETLLVEFRRRFPEHPASAR